MSLVRRYAKRKRRPESERKKFVGAWDKPTPPRNVAGRDFVQPHGGGASGEGASDAYILTALMSSSTAKGLQLCAIWKRQGGEVETRVICSSREMLLHAYPLKSVEEAIRAVSSCGRYSLSSYSTEASNVYLKGPAMSAFKSIQERVRRNGGKRKGGNRKRKIRSAKGGVGTSM